MIRTRVRLYANLKEKAGFSTREMELPSGCTVGKLLEILKQKYPGLIPHLTEKIVVAINQKIALRPDLIPDDAEVTIMPPIGGGKG